jgi:two-component system copper resistance phosphate regulon response regulator CusR
MKTDSPWCINRPPGEAAGPSGEQHSRRDMSSRETLQVVQSGMSRCARVRDAASRNASDDPWPERLPIGNHVLVCGQTLADDPWLLGKLEASAFRVSRHRSPKEARPALERDPAAVALLEATPPRQAEALEIVRRLDHRCRRRLLVVVWRPARRMVRHFVEAGAGDFLTLPAPASELLLRVELRAREARVSVFAEPPDRATLPGVNYLTGAIGPESSGVRLTDREYLLYDLLAQRFGNVVPRAEILSRIWSRGASESSSNIVDVYVRYLRVKLARVAPSFAITTVRHVGYVLEKRGEETRTKA